MNKFLKDKNEWIFYKSIISRWPVGFTKPIIKDEILADSQHCVWSGSTLFIVHPAVSDTSQGTWSEKGLFKTLGQA